MLCTPRATANDCCTSGAGLNVALPGWSASITHVPTLVNDTVAPAIVHTPAASALIENVTGSPEVAVAVTVYVAPPTSAAVGAGELKLIVWAPLPTAKLCCTCGAALKLALPPWLASITQVPAPRNDTVVPAIEHTPAALGSIVNPTASPEVAVAVTVYVAPSTAAATGAGEVKLMLWAPGPTANDCCTCGAALKFVSPAWLASITHVPAPVNDTVAPAIEHTPAEPALIVNAARRPEVAVAATV